MVTAELDVMAGASLMGVRLMAMKLEIMKLGRKVKKCLSPQICLSPKICLNPKKR